MNATPESLDRIAVEYRPLEWFKPYGRNPRRWDEAALRRMAALMREYGAVVPLLALPTGDLVDGHFRLAAAPFADMAELPVVIRTRWTPAQVRAFRLAVNKSAEFAEWADDLLRLELTELKDMGFDLALTGFDSPELDALLNPRTDDADERPDAAHPPERPVSRAGDLWLLGPHRLLCGDATQRQDVERLLAGAQPHLMVTDPPYGVEYDPAWRNGRADSLGRPIGPRAVGKVQNDTRVDWREAWALFPGQVAYVWHAGVHAAGVAESLIATGFEVRSQIIWRKQHFIVGRGHYHWQHEPCWYAVRKGGKGFWQGDRKQSTVWEIKADIGYERARPSEEEEHSAHATQKPLECMRRPMVNNSRRGDLVYDPFMGSGSTIIAAHTCERVALGLDIDAAYVDVAVQRWQKLSGEAARLDGDGRTFDELAGERLNDEMKTPAAS